VPRKGADQSHLKAYIESQQVEGEIMTLLLLLLLPVLCTVEK
jgi:hypothetical protein